MPRLLVALALLAVAAPASADCVEVAGKACAQAGPSGSVQASWRSADENVGASVLVATVGTWRVANVYADASDPGSGTHVDAVLAATVAGAWNAFAEDVRVQSGNRVVTAEGYGGHFVTSPFAEQDFCFILGTPADFCDGVSKPLA